MYLRVILDNVLRVYEREGVDWNNLIMIGIGEGLL